ncbi:MAG: sulfatase [Lentisphaerae bacterium GWF2_45_14]|nr:MAG: sulfatase [Lentisphaerae bacterium GWF2_45_14]
MTKRPNILLITSDQHHWNAVGYNNNEVKTPNIDRLAKEGTAFNRAYCPNPTCTPTRASIISGRYPSQHGAYSLGTKLPESEHCVGDDFNASGYRTALIGKAHFQQLLSTEKYPSLESNPFMQDLEFWKKFNGPFYGFEHVELARNHADEYHVGQHYALWMEEKGFKSWRDCFWPPAGNTPPQKHKWNMPEEFHYDRWIAERTNSFLEKYKNNGDNFFLWASFLDPHPPYLVPEPWDTMYNPEKISIPEHFPGEHDKNPIHFRMTQETNPDFTVYAEKGGNGCHGFKSHIHDKKSLAKDIAVYYGMISLMDKYIGTILDKLDSLGLTENTLVVFTTDHGHFYGHHGLIAKGPFHYEDMIKIPFVARMPGTVPSGKKSEALQSLVDLAPTFLAFSEIDIPAEMTGVNQKNAWTGEKDKIRDSLIVENRHQPTTINARTYVDERYKITVYYKRDYGEIFDLLEDPGELNNLWDAPEYSGLKSELLLKFIHAEMGKEPLPMPRVCVA